MRDHKFLPTPLFASGRHCATRPGHRPRPARARVADFKRVIALQNRSTGGRLIAIHSHGHDPGMEIIRGGGRGQLFLHDRHQIMKR